MNKDGGGDFHRIVCETVAKAYTSSTKIYHLSFWRYLKKRFHCDYYSDIADNITIKIVLYDTKNAGFMVWGIVSVCQYVSPIPLDTRKSNKVIFRNFSSLPLLVLFTLDTLPIWSWIKKDSTWFFTDSTWYDVILRQQLHFAWNLSPTGPIKLHQASIFQPVLPAAQN